jgi:cell wall-associated NlpC family hydrolase
MAQLSAEEIFAVARGAGFTPDQAVTFTAIALAESSGRTDALASKGEHSIGLWQVNVAANVRRNTWGDLTDPAVNARAAYEISKSGTNLRPWTVTHERNAGTARDYRRYLDEAEAARASAGSDVPSSFAGVLPTAPVPLDAPADLPADTDGDGVTDRAEIELGRSPVHADLTDRIGQAAAQARVSGDAVAAVPHQAGSPETGTPPASTQGPLSTFLDSARAQAGDRYIFGVEAKLSDVDPDAFDCSELVQWAAARAGVDITDGATYQYLALKQQGMVIPVEEAARTPGALLFSFSSEPRPGGGRPSRAHVAISLGDGQTIEARGRAYGVGEFAVGSRFQYAAVIPGLSGEVGSTAPSLAPSTMQTLVPSPWSADHDLDGLVDAAEAVVGTDPATADTDQDGVSDTAEVLMAHSNPLVRDTDLDGIPDDAELVFGTDPLTADAGQAWGTVPAGSSGLPSADPGDVLSPGHPALTDAELKMIDDLMT